MFLSKISSFRLEIFTLCHKGMIMYDNNDMLIQNFGAGFCGSTMKFFFTFPLKARRDLHSTKGKFYAGKTPR